MKRRKIETPKRERPRPARVIADSPRFLIGVTDAQVTFGNSVQVTIYASGTPGTAPTPVMITNPNGPGQIERKETAWFDWIAEDNPEPIPSNTDVAIEIAEHGEYRIVSAACNERNRVQ